MRGTSARYPEDTSHSRYLGKVPGGHVALTHRGLDRALPRYICAVPWQGTRRTRPGALGPGALGPFAPAHGAPGPGAPGPGAPGPGALGHGASVLGAPGPALLVVARANTSSLEISADR